MSELNVKLHKPTLIILLGIWVYSIAAALLPQSIPYASVFQGVLVFLLLAHAIECVVYRKRLVGVNEYLWTMYCGILFVKSKAKAVKKQKASA